MLFEDTVVSKIMEDFNTKCYVMNNEDKLFQLKTILGNFVFINEENKSKEIQGKNVLSFTKFVLGGFCPGGLAWGFLSCHRGSLVPLLNFYGHRLNEFGLRTQNTQHKNKTGQTAGTSRWLYSKTCILTCKFQNLEP